MVDLISTAPPADFDLTARAGQGGPDDDNGPGWIDAETVRSFASLSAAGQMPFPLYLLEAAPAALEAASLDELTALFQQELKNTFLDGAPTIGARRLGALQRALITTTENFVGGASPMGGVLIPNQLSLIIGRDEVRRYAERLVTRYDDKLPREAVEQLTLVTAAQLAELTGIKETTWTQWRNRGIGPRYLKPSRQTVRYPVVAVLEWIDSVVPPAAAN